MYLQDDLAEHTLPSPVYVDDPIYETMNGCSDWEYYSDDYYDDDPSLLKNNPQQGSPLQRNNVKKPSGLQRGKKRKLAATSDIPELSLNGDSEPHLRIMRPWFKGTIWKTSSPDNIEKKLYQPGVGERVALLGNWREVFRENPSIGSKRRQGWSARQPSHENPDTIARASSLETDLPQKASIIESNKSSAPWEDDTDASRDHKRPRVSFEKAPKSSVSNKIVVEIPLQRTNGMRKVRQENQQQTGQKLPPIRKRKVDDIADENTNEEDPKPRAKRFASGKAHSRAQKKEKPSPSTHARVTRSRKN